MFFVFFIMIINVKDGDFIKVFDYLFFYRENEFNGEVFVFVIFVIGDGGMFYEL